MKKVLLLTVLILLLSSVYLFSAVPCKINYQGRLIKDNVPVDGTKKMRFSIHDSAVGGDELWTSGEADVTVHNGLFRYVLDLSSIDNWTAGETLYLEVQIGTDILTPREAIYAYPYAINSHLLEGKTTDYFLNTSAEPQTKQGDLNIMSNVGIGGNVDIGGNVGIGTTSPTSKLDVSGAIKYSGSFTGTILYGNVNPIGTPTTDGFRVRQDGGFFGGTGDALVIEKTDGNANSPDGGIAFVNTGQDGIEDTAMVIRGNGNVGIGTTSPGAKLEVAGNLKATGGIEPDWDSGWVYVNRSNRGLKTLTHNLNYFPRQIQWWFSTSNPGSWVGPVAWSKQDYWSNPIGVWITKTQIKFTIWDRLVYRMYNASSWLNYNSGYYRILLWK
ncbi:hypothetical protein ES707_17775 [subsurface metagenome]